LAQPLSHRFESRDLQLVATLGPNSFEAAPDLVAAGATQLRLNASHMSAKQVFDLCRHLRAALPKTSCVVDLQGKKMRVGAIAPTQLELGAEVILTTNPSESDGLVVPHLGLFEQVALGEHLSFDDGRIEVCVVARESTRLVVKVERPGLLLPCKGLNRVEHPIELADLPESDQTVMSFCQGLEGVNFAVSFASDGSEADWVRSRAPNCRVILKVERQEAIDNLSSLAHCADELWICRGDLGVQLGLVELARQVARLDPHALEVPVLMAGQVLEHLTQHEQPTRSEICHLIDLVARGYAGIVLSDETAIGVGPANAVRWAARLMREH